VETRVIFFSAKAAVHSKTGGLNVYGIDGFLKACLQVNGFVRPEKMAPLENTF